MSDIVIPRPAPSTGMEQLEIVLRNEARINKRLNARGVAPLKIEWGHLLRVDASGKIGSQDASGNLQRLVVICQPFWQLDDLNRNGFGVTNPNDVTCPNCRKILGM